MKKIYTVLFFLMSALFANAAHIVGGEVYYNFLSSTFTSKTYRVTVVLFRDNLCGTTCAPLPTSVPVGIYNNDNGQLVGDFINIVRQSEVPLTIVQSPNCLTNTPTFNYSGGYYVTDITVENNAAGYTIAYQTCCRVSGINNVPPNGATDQGVTYYSELPGNNILQNGITDNGARFQTGISIICANKSFILDFSANDVDGDSLVYNICNGLGGGAATNAGFNEPAGPPYASLNYTSPFTGSQPLGSQASINTQTGFITGIAPAAGKYVVAVCVSSYRNGVFMNRHFKDFLITVSPCDFAAAELDLVYTNCEDSTFTFSNNNNSPLNLTFHWYFGDGNESTLQSPTHTYADTGVYIIKLVVNEGTNCADSSTSTVRVFPNFNTDFSDNTPSCINTNVQFTDQSTATYGPVNSWSWNFGDPASGVANTSTLQNPTHLYTTAGNYSVRLISTSPKGCIDTLTRLVEIIEKPNLFIGNDTLICIVDTLQLTATHSGSGTIVWTPNYNINNVNSFTPLVSPDVTTTYIATYNDVAGCSNSDTITITVVNDVTISTIPDTLICRTDAVRLQAFGNALSFSWTPTESLDDPASQSPLALPTNAQTTYTVTGTIGGCSRTASVVVRTVPYPNANAGADTAVCKGRNVPLFASGGSSYSWTPSFFLTATNIPNPVAVNPSANVSYVVTVRDTLGCPKPVSDTIRITVINIIANAGPRDTAVVIGQPLQLNGTGGSFYSWTPATYLNNPNIFNPVSNPQDSITYFLTVSDSNGCFGRDTIDVLLYRVPAGLYVPTAFTPDASGVNDVFRPICLGIRSLDKFIVYNRWGELVFSTNVIGKGWDGKFKGNRQGTSTFVWHAEATDYQGNKIKKKGTVVLIL